MFLFDEIHPKIAQIISQKSPPKPGIHPKIIKKIIQKSPQIHPKITPRRIITHPELKVKIGIHNHIIFTFIILLLGFWFVADSWFSGSQNNRKQEYLLGCFRNGPRAIPAPRSVLRSTRGRSKAARCLLFLVMHNKNAGKKMVKKFGQKLDEDFS